MRYGAHERRESRKAAAAASGAAANSMRPFSIASATKTPFAGDTFRTHDCILLPVEGLLNPQLVQCVLPLSDKCDLRRDLEEECAERSRRERPQEPALEPELPILAVPESQLNRRVAGVAVE